MFLEASACEEYSIDPNTLSEWLKKPDSIEKFDADLMESGVIEFKSSAWKPLRPIEIPETLPEERREEFLVQQEKDTVRQLNGAIIKTVAGFLNTSGGELIIGMADDGEILGVEQDCEYPGIREFRCISTSLIFPLIREHRRSDRRKDKIPDSNS